MALVLSPVFFILIICPMYFQFPDLQDEGTSPGVCSRGIPGNLCR